MRFISITFDEYKMKNLNSKLYYKCKNYYTYYNFHYIFETKYTYF